METSTFSEKNSTVEVYILNENKEFIIVFSAEDNNICSIPSGVAKEEENLEDAAKRIAKEELAADIKIIGVSKNTFSYGEKKGKSVVAVLAPKYLRLKILGKDISGYKWINKDQIYNYLENLDKWLQAEKVFKEFSDYF